METDLDTLELTEFVSVSESWRGINLRVGTMAEAPDPRNHDQQDIRSPITSSDIKEEDPEEKQKSTFCNYLFDILGITPKKTSRSFGLPNIGNSCYMNATLQCLGSTQELKSFFSDTLSMPMQVYSSGSCFIILNEFAAAMNSMWEGRTREINLGHIKNVTAQFHGTSQQDCQEYLTAVLETLHTALKSPPNYISCASDALATQADKCWLNYLSTHGNSIVVDTFQGLLQTHLQCQQCKAVFKRFDPFASIATPIRITEESLHNCIKQFMSKESIGNWPCCACGKTVSVDRSIAISKAPKVLLIHLNRFHQDVSGKRHKIETFVDFPFELDISEHCRSGDSSQPSCVYDLFAVIHHFGTISSGHSEMDPTEMDPTEMNTTEMDPTEINTTEMNPTEMNTTEMDPTEMGPVTDETLICGKGVEHEDENLSGQICSNLES
ncbi:hypothetical protein EMCRGX_G015773 [Ephydatia muelleri]